METKKCLQCGNEFESKVAPGVEQKYCSRQCRMKAGNNRRFETIKNNIVNEIKGSSISQPERVAESYNSLQGTNTRIADGFRNITDNHLATIKELYEAKTETNFYKLKVEQLEKENNELKTELFEYENDESEQNEENNNGWLSGVEKTLPTLVKSYREDPEATMGFIGSSANMLFNSIFKSKANASTISS
jgi:ribosomal protein L29